MIDLKSMTLEELTAWLQEQGEPAFRGKQVFRWFYRGATSFGEMSDLSKPLRQKLEEQCFLSKPKVARKQVSALDGTIKYLWELADGNCIETVLMRSVSPVRWAAAWGVPFVPLPWLERSGI